MSGASAMVLAAGRGERMRPLTDTTPKPLLPVRGKPLMQYHLEALARGGFRDIVVNTAWLGLQVSGHFGASPKLDVPGEVLIHYSAEGKDFGGRDGPGDYGALETAGGIARALPLLDDVFWVVAGDVFAPLFEFTMDAARRFAVSGKLAHLWLVPNPPHNPKGDFGLAPDGAVLNRAEVKYTYSTIGLYNRQLFTDPRGALTPGNALGVKAPLAPLLRAAMDNGLVTGELYHGPWTDVGTPERLAQINGTDIQGTDED